MILLSLDEQTVVAMTFIHSPASDPLLAVLHQDVRENRHLKTYYVSTAQKALKKGPLHGQEVEQGANLLIPVPAPYRGVLIVGEQTVTYLGDRTPNKPISINYSITIMTSWAAIDEEGSPLRFLLGDRYGQLHVLLLFTRGNDITELKLETLGTVREKSWDSNG